MQKELIHKYFMVTSSSLEMSRFSITAAKLVFPTECQKEFEIPFDKEFVPATEKLGASVSTFLMEKRMFNWVAYLFCSNI